MKLNIMPIVNVIMLILVLSSMFTIGWISNDIYKDIGNKRTIDGLRLGEREWTDAKERAYELDEYGDWVCVNVKGMSYERGLEVCQHEMGHEIFAEYCEKNIDKCIEVTKNE